MWFSDVLSAFLFGYLLYRFVAAQKVKPVLTKSDIIYQERFASGHSEANLMTKLGGARNCLRLIVTANTLIVTSWFPFALFTAFYDLEHVIPLRAISEIEPRRRFGVDYLLLTYRDSQGPSHQLGLTPKDREGFLESIGSNASLTV